MKEESKHLDRGQETKRSECKCAEERRRGTLGGKNSSVAGEGRVGSRWSKGRPFMRRERNPKSHSSDNLVTAHVRTSPYTMSNSPAFNYNVRWMTRTFTSRAQVEALLGPEEASGAISSHDYQAAISFFPGFHRYYGVRIFLLAHRTLTHSFGPVISIFSHPCCGVYAQKAFMVSDALLGCRHQHRLWFSRSRQCLDSQIPFRLRPLPQ